MNVVERRFFFELFYVERDSLECRLTVWRDSSTKIVGNSFNFHPRDSHWIRRFHVTGRNNCDPLEKLLQLPSFQLRRIQQIGQAIAILPANSIELVSPASNNQTVALVVDRGIVILDGNARPNPIDQTLPRYMNNSEIQRTIQSSQHYCNRLIQSLYKIKLLDVTRRFSKKIVNCSQLFRTFSSFLRLIFGMIMRKRKT